ncbi:MAG: hypothetical protein L0219_17055, partial [Phycisphaerales bacterium]|nr:hypothetical protein [Phycisphaerales bacterium]
DQDQEPALEILNLKSQILKSQIPNPRTLRALTICSFGLSRSMFPNFHPHPLPRAKNGGPSQKLIPLWQTRAQKLIPFWEICARELIPFWEIRAQRTPLPNRKS